jgi:polyferredoxin
MSTAAIGSAAAVAPRPLLARLGTALRTHARVIRVVQWTVVALYLVLIVVPALLPLPPDDARALDHLAVLAQWAFWGVWWPLVLLSMFVAGRAWCGLFCPEGTLTEAASRFGRGRPAPRWMRWGGWPFVAFVLTTIYGQLVSVYQYATAALLVLGGSTLAAVVVGFLYGREKRVWCRYLCPVSGVFGLLARLAPVHFRVDAAAWSANAGHIPIHPVNCAPMVRIRRMEGNAECHMCGRCSGHLGAVALTARSPEREVVELRAGDASRYDVALIVYGLIGVAIGAFHWNVSPWFVELKLLAAGWVIDHGPAWLLRDDAPWWLLTHYPQANDVFTPLDGVLIVAYIGATALVLGAIVHAALRLAARAWPNEREAHARRLAYALIPLAGLGVFLGLSGLTVTLMRHENLGVGFVPLLRAAALALGAAWSIRLAWRQSADIAGARRVAATGAFGVAVAAVLASWVLLYVAWA